MFYRSLFLVIVSLFLSLSSICSIISKSHSQQSVIYSLDELNEQYNRGINFWENGNGRAAYYTLDSLRKIDLTQENALIKSKGMSYLANCFFSQKNYRYAINYATLSLNFGNDLISINEKLALYNLLITSYHETHNNNQESYFTTLCKSINDSIQNAKMKFQVDSLKEALEKQKNTPTSTNEEDGIGEQITSSTSDSTSNPFIIAIISAIVIGVLLFFILKSRNNSTTSVKKSSVEIPKIDARDHKNINALVEKIAKVELVFIRAEVLGEYGNKKSVVKIINDYNEQLPLIIKNLDEAISTNDNEPIIHALSYLKPYLTAFGMAATLAMLNEVEAEAPTEKTTKLLSRVFQIRNHIRRAHDETKALIEVLG